MQRLVFRSVFSKLFASVMLALTLFAVAMVLLTQLVHDKDASIRSRVLATQILGQIDPFLTDLNVAISNDNLLQSRFMLAVIKKSFDIFDESLQAKMGLYDNDGHLLMQTNNSDLPLQLPPPPSLLARTFPLFTDTPPTQQAQVYSSTGYTLLYESRLPPKKPPLSAALNLFTGTLLLLIIMAGVLWWIARNMTWRINQMSQQMAQLGDGDFSVRVNARGNDEITSLARGFNQAAQKIEHLINANNLLLAHASHELRTPITRIRLQIEMMDMLVAGMPEDIKAKFDKRAQAVNRDLSGLNDLVDSILLVSRLDAGHALQQTERLDLYDVINQERQHYPQATLIGKHITIDGQAAMLTHLIRNLLTNAMLHGEPPVTILLYGAHSLATADTLPDDVLQALLSSGLMALSVNDRTDDAATALSNEASVSSVSADADVSATDTMANPSNSDPKTAPTKAVEQHARLTPSASDNAAPVLFKNGATLSVEASSVVDTLTPTPSHTLTNKAATTTASATVDPTTEHPDLSQDPADSTAYGLDHNIVAPEATGSQHNSKTAPRPNIADKTNSEPQTTTPNTPDMHRDSTTNARLSARRRDTERLSQTPVTEASAPATAAPRKEGLFKKHLNKPKAAPSQPVPKYAVLAVIDEGAGIPSDKRTEIFSPFVRLQQKKKGSGLGLSLVAQIVKAHQGYIKTDTINGHTRFLVVLPVTHDPDYHFHDHDSHF